MTTKEDYYWQKQHQEFLYRQLGKAKKKQIPLQTKANMMQVILSKLEQMQQPDYFQQPEFGPPSGRSSPEMFLSAAAAAAVVPTPATKTTVTASSPSPGPYLNHSNNTSTNCSFSSLSSTSFVAPVAFHPPPNAPRIAPISVRPSQPQQHLQQRIPGVESVRNLRTPELGLNNTSHPSTTTTTSLPTSANSTPKSTPRKPTNKRGPLQPSPMQLIPNYGNYAGFMAPSPQSAQNWSLSAAAAEEHQRLHQRASERQKILQQQLLESSPPEPQPSQQPSQHIQDRPGSASSESNASEASTQAKTSPISSLPASFSALQFAGGTLSVLLGKLCDHLQEDETESYKPLEMTEREWDRLRRGLIDLFASTCEEEGDRNANWRILIPKGLSDLAVNYTSYDEFLNQEWESVSKFLENEKEGRKWAHFLAIWQTTRVAQSSIVVAEKAMREISARAKAYRALSGNFENNNNNNNIESEETDSKGKKIKKGMHQLAGTTVKSVLLDPISIKIDNMRSSCNLASDVLSDISVTKATAKILENITNLPAHWKATSDVYRLAPVPFEV